MEELIKTYQEYIIFLKESSVDIQQVAWIHGWRCDIKDIDKGIEFRAKIKELEDKL
jgi:hypothetical protein